MRIAFVPTRPLEYVADRGRQAVRAFRRFL